MRNPTDPSSNASTALRTTTSGALLALASMPLGVLHSVDGSFFEASRVEQIAATAACALFLLAGSTITHAPRLARVAASGALFTLFYLAWPTLKNAPLLTFSVLIAATLFITLLWKIGSPLIGASRDRHRPLYEGRAQGAALIAVGMWTGWSFVTVEHSVGQAVIVGWPLGCCAAFTLLWAVRNYAARRRRAQFVATLMALGVLLLFVLRNQPWLAVSALVLPAITVAIALRDVSTNNARQVEWWQLLLGHPERLFVGTFAAACAAGTALLALPHSAAAGTSIGFIDAAFTATSAVCVTGLIVLDTPLAFSGFGHFVLLLLIQIGGLGIMTFSTAAIWALGKRMSLQHEGAVAQLMNTRDRSHLFESARRVLYLTLVSELLGAAALAIAFFVHGDSLFSALWRGVFTSISAFCNAGFALQSDSLVGYQNEPFVLHVVGLLIIVGGLSPLAVFAIPRLVRRRGAPVSAQARLALVVSGVLLLGGFLLFLALEWNSALAPLSTVDKLHNAWFQSVTFRTAGFNSVDLNLAGPATLIFAMLLMFIGGSPGGTAGGVKTTTVGILMLSVVHAIRGQYVLNVFAKRVPVRTQTRAAVVVVVAATTGIIALVAVLLTQSIPAQTAVFEVVSALGTVGLSLGGTAQLDDIGKVVIVVCMFMGRVGGLTLLLFLSSRVAPFALGRPEEEIDVG